jgi:hypothetical protein
MKDFIHPVCILSESCQSSVSYGMKKSRYIGKFTVLLARTIVEASMMMGKYFFIISGCGTVAHSLLFFFSKVKFFFILSFILQILW